MKAAPFSRKLSFKRAFGTLKTKTQERDALLDCNQFVCEVFQGAQASDVQAIWSSFSFRLPHFLLPQLLISHVSHSVCRRGKKWDGLHSGEEMQLIGTTLA